MLDAFISFADAICLPLSATKTVKPTQILTFLGIELNSLNMTANLTLGKINTLPCRFGRFIAHQIYIPSKFAVPYWKTSICYKCGFPGQAFYQKVN